MYIAAYAHLFANLDDPVAIDQRVSEIFPCRYDWMVHNGLWYFPTLTTPPAKRDIGTMQTGVELQRRNGTLRFEAVPFGARHFEALNREAGV